MDIALTIDYELFGNGDGNVVKNILLPTEKLLSVCSEFEVKLTIFFEVVEYWKLNDAYENGQNMQYLDNPAKLMAEQIVQAYKDGHDVQLHIHPQWLGGEYDGGWHLNEKYWRLPNVPASKTDICEMTLTSLLTSGKKTLERLIRPIDPSYECTILRAGGLNILPSEKILQAMRASGLKADSSVYSGGYKNSAFASYDYRSISNRLLYWRTTSDNILDSSEDRSCDAAPIYEIPIFAIPIRRYQKYDLSRLKAKLIFVFARQTARRQAKMKIKDLNFNNFLFEKESNMWDYCLLSYSKMKLFLEEAIKICNKSPFNYHPFILIGHSKEFLYPKVLIKALQHYSSNVEKIRYSTLSEVLKRIRSSYSSG